MTQYIPFDAKRIIRLINSHKLRELYLGADVGTKLCRLVPTLYSILTHAYTYTLTQQHNLVKNRMQNRIGDKWLNNYLVTNIERYFCLYWDEKIIQYIYVCVCVRSHARVMSPLFKISESVTDCINEIEKITLNKEINFYTPMLHNFFM